MRSRGRSCRCSQDEFHTVELEARQPTRDETPLARKIRVLENRLDKAMIKFNEAQSIRKTYEQIVARLGEERVSFDTQVAAMERTLRAREKDIEELQLLAGACPPDVRPLQPANAHSREAPKSPHCGQGDALSPDNKMRRAGRRRDLALTLRPGDLCDWCTCAQRTRRTHATRRCRSRSA